jgi:hypothetical protein
VAPCPASALELASEEDGLTRPATAANDNTSITGANGRPSLHAAYVEAPESDSADALGACSALRARKAGYGGITVATSQQRGSKDLYDVGATITAGKQQLQFAARVGGGPQRLTTGLGQTRIGSQAGAGVGRLGHVTSATSGSRGNDAYVQLQARAGTAESPGIRLEMPVVCTVTLGRGQGSPHAEREAHALSEAQAAQKSQQAKGGVPLPLSLPPKLHSPCKKSVGDVVNQRDCSEMLLGLDEAVFSQSPSPKRAQTRVRLQPVSGLPLDASPLRSHAPNKEGAGAQQQEPPLATKSAADLLRKGS